MTRLKIVAANWKMNLYSSEAKALYSEVASKEIPSGTKVIVSPPALYLSEFADISSKGAVLAAQNCSHMDSGAFTGEISAGMLKSIGLEYVIVGHSERRELYGETDQIVGAKVKKAMENGLNPIFCCGELLEERENSEQEAVVSNQIEEGLFHLTGQQIQKVVIAYEPVWAIGTGKTASTDEVQEMHSFIRGFVSKKYGETIANSISILYGGSVKPANAKSIFGCPDVDGGLVGGASLNIADFQSLIASI